MLASPPLDCFTRLEGAPRAGYTLADVDGPGFTRAWRITTRELAPNAWDLRLRCFATPRRRYLLDPQYARHQRVGPFCG